MQACSGFSIILVHFGFLKLKERKKAEGLDTAWGGVESLGRYLQSAGEVASWGVSCACGGLSISRVCHIAHNLRTLGENS